MPEGLPLEGQAAEFPNQTGAFRELRTATRLLWYGWMANWFSKIPPGNLPVQRRYDVNIDDRTNLGALPLSDTLEKGDPSAFWNAFPLLSAFPTGKGRFHHYPAGNNFFFFFFFHLGVSDSRCVMDREKGSRLRMISKPIAIQTAVFLFHTKSFPLSFLC